MDVNYEYGPGENRKSYRSSPETQNYWKEREATLKAEKEQRKARDEECRFGNSEEPIFKTKKEYKNEIWALAIWSLLFFPVFFVQDLAPLMAVPICFLTFLFVALWHRLDGIEGIPNHSGKASDTCRSLYYATLPGAISIFLLADRFGSLSPTSDCFIFSLIFYLSLPPLVFFAFQARRVRMNLYNYGRMIRKNKVKNRILNFSLYYIAVYLWLIPAIVLF